MDSAMGHTDALLNSGDSKQGVGGIPSIILRSSRLPDILNYKDDIKLLPHWWFTLLFCSAYQQTFASRH